MIARTKDKAIFPGTLTEIEDSMSHCLVLVSRWMMRENFPGKTFLEEQTEARMQRYLERTPITYRS